MIPIAGLILPVNRDHAIYIPVYFWLQSQDVKDWPPITVEGKRVIDGLQRVLAAQLLGYTEIPGKAIT